MSKEVESYEKFKSWQCRLRKMSMRELKGVPTQGMTAGVYSTRGGEEQSRLSFMILKDDMSPHISEFRHIVKKSKDPADWMKNGLKILAEWYYHDPKIFRDDLTALFSIDSNLAAAMLQAGKVRLKFNQDSIQHDFDFEVTALDESDEAFQATYWHNHLFNPTLPGQVQVLKMSPSLDGATEQ